MTKTARDTSAATTAATVAEIRSKHPGGYKKGCDGCSLLAIIDAQQEQIAGDRAVLRELATDAPGGTWQQTAIRRRELARKRLEE